tara:strand:+ start:295 stop:861 length:567 start_codon:yes stop_codon:yes gene_type:complete
MKIDEITNSDKLDEVPAGGLTQFARKAGSKILNKLPGATAKSKAGNLAGKADLGDTANNLHKEFNTYLGTQGKNMKAATGEDFQAFLQSKGHKTSAEIPSGVLQKKQLDDLLIAASKEALAGKGGAPKGAGKATAPAKGGKGKQTAKPTAPSGGTAQPKAPVKIPNNISKQLSGLSSAKKQQLAGMLQ